jgi:flagellar protein FlaG
MSLGNISIPGGDEAPAVRYRGSSAGGTARPRAPASEASPADAAPAVNPTAPAEAPRSANAIAQAVRELALKSNHALESMNHKLRFQVHDETGQLMVQLIDFETGEVLRQQPPEEFLDLAARMREMVGIFLDRTS